MLKTVSTSSSGGTSGGLTYQGAWNASTNTPTLTSGVGTNGYYYVVSVAGTTTLDGVSLWSVGDWVIFNGTTWQKLDGSNTEAFTSITVTGLTGYMYANNTSPVTASTTIPVANVAGAVANTVNIIAGTGLSGGGALTGNVTLTNAGVTSFNTRNGAVTLTSSDVTTALGYTPGTGNGSVTSITAGTGLNGGTITTSGTINLANTTVTAGNYTNTNLTVDAQGRITAASNGSAGGVTTFSAGTTGLTPASATTGAITLGGTLVVSNGGTGLTSLTAGYIPYGAGTSALASYSGFNYNTTYNTLNTPTLSVTSTTNTTPALTFNASNTSVASGTSVAGSYLQSLFQNSSNTAGASVNYVLSNNLGTDSSYYGEFGMNSSFFSASTPVDFFSINNGIYFSGHDGDISIGSGNGYKTYLTYGSTGQYAHVINASGAIGLSTNLGTTPALSGTTGFGTAGQVLTSQGSSAPPTWGALSASYVRTTQTATASQTTFSVTYTAPYIEVYLNGVLLNTADYTASNGTTVVLSTGAGSGDILDFVAYNTVSIGSVAAAGSNTQVQYNSSGVLGASSGFTFDGTNLNIPFGPSNSPTSVAKIAYYLGMVM
jgi:hypothetical protein